jgi:hypothetical protein
MKNLGKIFLILIIPFYTFASVVASVDSTEIVKGEDLTLNISISGEDIKKPLIDSICGYDITSSGSQTSIKMINGDYTKNYILSYKFTPLDSCTIEPIEIEIDGKKEKTKPIDIKVKEYIVDKNSDFILTLSTDKKEVMIGESFDVDVVFKHKKGVGVVDSRFEEPQFKGFWIKKQSDQKTYQEANHNVIKITYTLAAQREGIQNITPAKIAIASRVSARDSWGMWMQNVKWKTYFSNSLDIDVKALPNGLKYIGDFKIKAEVDKTQVEQNEAVNLTLTIQGKGNLEDIKSFKPIIAAVSVFDEKIAIKEDTLTQKMAFVADGDFKIKPFTLRYFDTKTKKEKTISTKEISIKVNSLKPKEQLVVKKENIDIAKENKKTISSDGIPTLWAVAIFISGVLVGIGIMLLKPWERAESKKKLDIKDEKLLLVKLLPYKDDENVQKLIDTLERNIYESKEYKVDKKLLKECLNRYLDIKL